MDIFNIKLFSGKITGKSGFNFSNFVNLLDSNVKYSLALVLLKALGLKVSVTDTNTMEFLVSNPAHKENFQGWLVEKQEYNKKQDKVILQQVVAEEV